MKRITLSIEFEIKLGYYQYRSTIFPNLCYIFYDKDAYKIVNKVPAAKSDARVFENPQRYRGESLKDSSLLYFAVGTYKELLFDIQILKFLEEEYSTATIDVVAHIDVFVLFQRFGFRGGWNKYPIQSEVAEKYDYVFSNEILTDNSWASGRMVMEKYRSILPDDVLLQPISFLPNSVLKEEKREGDSASYKIGIHLNSEHPINNYPLSNHKKLIQLLGSKDIRTMVVGYPSMQPGIEGIGAESYVGKHRSILEILSLLSQVDLIITSDPFVARAGGICGKPTIVLLSTDDEKGYSSYSFVKPVSSEDSCVPCYRHDKCPLGHGECKAFYHESVAPEIILERVIQVMKNDTGANG